MNKTDNRTNSDQSRNRAGARKGLSKGFPRPGGVDGRGRATNSDDFGLVQCGVTLGGVLGALGLRLGVVVCADAASRQRRGRPLWGAVYPPTCKASSFHHGDRRRDWAAVFTAGRDPSKPQRIPADGRRSLVARMADGRPGLDGRLLLPPNHSCEFPSFHAVASAWPACRGLGGRVACPIRQNWPWLPAASAQWAGCIHRTAYARDTGRQEKQQHRHARPLTVTAAVENTQAAGGDW